MEMVWQDHGSKVPIDLSGSFPVSNPKASLSLFAKN